MTTSRARAHPSGWPFGRLFRSVPPVPDNETAATAAAPLPLATQAKQDLLSAMSAFLLHHGLSIDPNNLTMAFEALSGANPRFGAKVAERLHAGLPITQQWLNERSDHASLDHERAASLRMIRELEASLQRYAHSTAEARTATQHYGQKLSDHSAQMEEARHAQESLHRLRLLTLDMAEKTRGLERAMAEQEKEAADLRRRLAKVKRDAEVDPLTGLPNRHAFNALLQQEMDTARTGGNHLSIAICDIDQFQQINDAHGHDTGDRLLKLVAKLLGAMPVKHFHIGRHSRAEFVLLFRGVSTLEAKDLLEDMRAHIASRRLISRDSNQPLGAVNISAGIANAFAYRALPLALRAADAALFQAKNARNSAVQIASP